MAGENYLVPPVERNLMPLTVIRTSERKERQNEKSREDLSQRGSGNEKREKNAKKQKKSEADNLISATKVDCKV